MPPHLAATTEDCISSCSKLNGCGFAVVAPLAVPRCHSATHDSASCTLVSLRSSNHADDRYRTDAATAWLATLARGVDPITECVLRFYLARKLSCSMPSPPTSPPWPRQPPAPPLPPVADEWLLGSHYGCVFATGAELQKLGLLMPQPGMQRRASCLRRCAETAWCAGIVWFEPAAEPRVCTTLAHTGILSIEHPCLLRLLPGAE
eukprot:3183368-Prymnesium_polylepis.1